MLNEIFDKKCEQLKLLAEVLKKYSHPNNCQEIDNELLLIKKSEICFDGYNLVFHFTKSKYQDFLLENLQVYSLDFSILPFDIPFKFAKHFFKKIDNISYLESEVDNKRVYCWIFLSKNGKKEILLPVEEYSKVMDYEGVKFFYITLPFLDFLK
jgi:hypothetical protein